MTSRVPDTVALTTTLLRQRAAVYAATYPGTLRGDEEAIHDLRVAARRLRVALPLLVRDPDGPRARSVAGAVREVGRAAAESRDLDVLSSLLGGTWSPRPTGPERTLARRLRDARGRSRRRMAEALLDLDIARLRRELRLLTARAEPLFVVLARLRRRRDELQARALRAVRVLGERFAPEPLHDLRILCRRLRYLAELQADLKGVDDGGAALLKSLQDPLGLVQDAQVAAAWLRLQARASAERGQHQVAAEARRRAAAWRRAGRQHHRVFLSLNPAVILVRALGGQRSAAVAPSRTDPRPKKTLAARCDSGVTPPPSPSPSAVR